MEAQIKEVMEDILGVEPDEIDDSFGSDQAELWDSLNHLRLASALEDSFDIRFTMGEIEYMRSFGKIRETIQGHVAKT